MILEEGFEERMAKQLDEAVKNWKPDNDLINITSDLFSPGLNKNNNFFDIESIKKVMDNFKQNYPEPEFDAYVCLTNTWERVKKELAKEIKFVGPMQIFDSLFGISVYIYSNINELWESVKELESEGRKICLIEEYNGQLHYGRYIPSYKGYHSSWS